MERLSIGRTLTSRRNGVECTLIRQDAHQHYTGYPKKCPVVNFVLFQGATELDDPSDESFSNMLPLICRPVPVSMYICTCKYFASIQVGRSWGSWEGASPKVGNPTYIFYFVAINTLLKGLGQGFQRKSACFCKALRLQSFCGAVLKHPQNFS